jgi:predicted TIM-barrel fold metal-dependent hydrolase
VTVAAARVAGVIVLFGLCADSGFGAAPAAAPTARYYTQEDFWRVEKIDAHVHVHGPADRFMAQAIADRFSVLTINVDDADFPDLATQRADAVSLVRRYRSRVAFAATFPMAGFGTAGWTESALRGIHEAMTAGAVGVKVWKNIGMEQRDPDGSYVMLDDPRLAPIFSMLEREHVVLLGHQAEPLNCWLPLDQMTVRGDRDYYRTHPQYYMYQQPGRPSHDAILAARDRMLTAHPGLRFDAVHLASLEWDVDKVADFLDRFPAAKVDMAARLVHLEYQAASHPQKVRDFLIRYQDRVLYGSDDAYGPGDSDPKAVAEIHADWLADWRFLATADRMHSVDFSSEYRGLRLPRAVIDKIYRRNAQAMFGDAWPVP